jgi:hypothetical protein
MADLFDARAVPLHEQLACAEREVKFRIRVYARRVIDGKMTQAQSDREIAAMKAILETLQRLQRREAA